ncbi:MAG TPA: hypothetical protein VN457_07705 [Chlamydiales bacterium]|nr:hypothetical protein [Chlamydiales bacterium]
MNTNSMSMHFPEQAPMLIPIPVPTDPCSLPFMEPGNTPPPQTRTPTPPSIPPIMLPPKQVVKPVCHVATASVSHSVYHGTKYPSPESPTRAFGGLSLGPISTGPRSHSAPPLPQHASTPKSKRKAKPVNLKLFEERQKLDTLLQAAKSAEDLLHHVRNFRALFTVEQLLRVLQQLEQFALQASALQPKDIQPIIQLAVELLEKNEFESDQIKAFIELAFDLDCFPLVEDAILRKENKGVIKISPEAMAIIANKCSWKRKGSEEFLLKLYKAVNSQYRSSPRHTASVTKDLVHNGTVVNRKPFIKMLKASDGLHMKKNWSKLKGLSAEELADMLCARYKVESTSKKSWIIPTEELLAIHAEIIAGHKEKRRLYTTYSTQALHTILNVFAKANMLSADLRDQLIEAELLANDGAKLKEADCNQLLNIGLGLTIAHSKNKELFTQFIDVLSEAFRPLAAGFAQRSAKEKDIDLSRLNWIMVHINQELLGVDTQWGHEITSVVDAWRAEKAQAAPGKTTVTQDEVVAYLQVILGPDVVIKTEQSIEGHDVDILFKIPGRKGKGCILEIDGDTHFREDGEPNGATRSRNVQLISAGYDLNVITPRQWRETRNGSPKGVVGRLVNFLCTKLSLPIPVQLPSKIVVPALRHSPSPTDIHTASKTANVFSFGGGVLSASPQSASLQSFSPSPAPSPSGSASAHTPSPPPVLPSPVGESPLHGKKVVLMQPMPLTAVPMLQLQLRMSPTPQSSPRLETHLEAQPEESVSASSPPTDFQDFIRRCDADVQQLMRRSGLHLAVSPSSSMG